MHPNSKKTNTRAATKRWAPSASCWLALACLFGSAGPLGAQTSPNAPAAGPTPLSVDGIQSLREQASKSTELDAAAKQVVDAACAEALDFLKRIAALEGETTKLQSDARSVDQRVSARRERLRELQSRKPPGTSWMSIAELEQRVSKQELDLAALKKEQAKWEAETARRVGRRRQIRDALFSVDARVAEVQKELASPVPAGEPALLTTARRAALQAKRRFIEAEPAALQAELAKVDAEDAADYVRLERDVYALEVRVATIALDAVREQLARRRAEDTAAAVSRARGEVEAAAERLRPLADANLAFAVAADDLTQPIDATQRALESRTALHERLQKQFTTTRQRVDDIGLTGSIGALLRRQRAELPNLRAMRQDVQKRKRTIEETQYSLFQYDDLRSTPTDIVSSRVLAAIADAAERQALADSVKELMTRRRDYLDGVIRNHNAYLDALFDLDATEQRLIREVTLYQNYIDERVLWIRSNRPLYASVEMDASDAWILRPERWAEVGAQIGRDSRANPLIHGAALVIFALLLWNKNRMIGELTALGERTVRVNFARFLPTLRATFLTVLLSLAWPGAVLFLAWRLNASANGSQFARAVAEALFAVGRVYFPLELLRRTFRPGGLAERHFHWPQSLVGFVRANTRFWVVLIGLIVVFVTATLYASEREHGVDFVERISYVVGMTLLAFATARVLDPQTGVFQEYVASHPNGWVANLRRLWFWAAVSVPLVLAGLAITGYYYTAQHLLWRIFATLVLLFMLQVLGALLRRLLLMQRRRISLQRAAASQSAAREGEGTTHGPEQIIPIEELEPDISENTEQSQRLIHTALIATSLVSLWFIWVDVLPALRMLDQWRLWSLQAATAADSTAGQAAATTATAAPAGATAPMTTAAPSPSSSSSQAVTMADLGLALLIGAVTVVCARNMPGLLEIAVLQRLPVDNSIRYAVTSIASYLIILLGVVLASSALSIGWSKVQWLVTALTFGLAFGLQEIFANFVAGLILLFERPLRIGDVVTVDDVTGVVSRIRMRATTITNWDRKEYVIPNKEFITGRMLNWTLSDKTNRIVINVGVAYGSDIERAREVLLETCNGHPLILDDPPTLVTFEEFGDNSLNLVVRTFLPDLSNRLPVIHDLHTAIDAAFRREGIEIAFPQRDLHLRSVDPDLLAKLGAKGQQESS